MIRLTLILRLGTFILICAAVAWIAGLSIYYRSLLAHDLVVLPPPGRLAALARLIETVPASERAAAILATSAPAFTPRIDDAPTEPPPHASATIALQGAYADALDGRPFVMTALSAPRERPPFAFLTEDGRNGYAFRIGLRDGRSLVVETRNPLPVTPLGLPLGFGAGLFGTLVALAALLLMYRETRPLARLAAGLDRFDLSGAPVDLPDVRRNAPEIRAVIGAFARLQDRLAELLRARMALVGGIAHDVRTFATRLRLRIDALPDPDERKRAVADIEDMIRLLDDALLASRTGAGELAQSLVDLVDLARGEVEERRRRGEVVRYLGPPPEAGEIAVLGDRLALRRILANLLDNAVAYGHAADIRLTRNRDGAELAVEDEGPGIPPELRHAMLEPFTRLESSRSRRTGGAGLGLAVARGLAEAHGGSLTIGDGRRGARILVRLPVFAPGGNSP